MNCVNCGKPLRPGAMFCPQCGTKQPEQKPVGPPAERHPPASDIPPQQPAPPSYSYSQQGVGPSDRTYEPVHPKSSSPKQKRRWPLILGIVAAILCLLCLCVAAIAFAASQGVINLPFDLPTLSPGEGIGPEGGEVSGPDGVRVIIPEGALSETVPFNIVEAESAPSLPSDVEAVGTPYDISVPEGTEFLAPVQVELPVEQLDNVGEEPLLVYAWDGVEWQDMGGIVEDNIVRFETSHFSIFQVVRGYTPRRPVRFINSGPYDAIVRPWTWELRYPTRINPGGASCVAWRSGVGPVPRGCLLSLPFGTYTWCIDWNEGDQNNDGSIDWYHYIDDRPMSLDANDPEPPELATSVDISTDQITPARQEGRCPRQPGVGGGGTDPGQPTPFPTMGVGDITIRLTWNETADLDLHVIEPSGTEIYFGSPTSSSGGELDRDANFPCSTATTSPAENVYWNTGAPTGEYEVDVRYFGECNNEGSVTFQLVVMVGGRAVVDESRTLENPSDNFTISYTR